MQRHVRILEKKPRGAHLLQAPPLRLLRALERHVVNDLILHLIVEHAGGHRLPSLRGEHPERRIHIDRELQLQPVVKLVEVKFDIPRLVVDDLDIDFAVRIAGINPVDAPHELKPPAPGQRGIERRQAVPAAERSLLARRRKITRGKLLRLHPDRLLHEPLHAAHRVRVPRAVRKNPAAVAADRLADALIRIALPAVRILLQIRPGLPVAPRHERKMLQSVVQDRSQTESRKFIFLPRPQPQPVGEEMRVLAGRILLEPRSRAA